jgi:serine/threonine protein kinase
MVAAVAAPEPNLVLAGRYRLEKRLGAGGMGAIWHAEHLVLRAPVAVKLLNREALPDEETIARFMREAQAAATLRSPHVVQIFDYGVDGGWPFIVMELLEGENLAQRLKRVKRLTPEQMLRILTHVARAMVRAHGAGIVHRDLKPENIFLIRNEDEEIAKVVDFGVAKVSSTAMGQDSARTRTGSILGTPYYMSPEQAQGNKTVDNRSDMWSLAVIAFECLTGTRPFYSDGLGDLVLSICVRDIPVPSDRAPVPLGFDAWFAKAVARDPDLRFQNPRTFIVSLRDALGLETERAGSDPDILVSTSAGDGRDTRQGQEPFSDRPPPSAVPTVAHGASAGIAEIERGSAVQVVSARRSQTSPDVNAATMVAAAPDPDDSPSAPAVTDAQFGTSSQQRAPQERKTALGGVILVAFVALAAGLVAGFVALPSQLRKDQGTTALPSALPPRALDQPRPKPPTRREVSSQPSAQPIESVVVPAPSAIPSAAAPGAKAAKAAPSASAAPVVAPVPKWDPYERSKPEPEPVVEEVDDPNDDPYR